VVSEGSRGGVLVRVGPDGPAATVRYRPTATDRETDPTGAGDTFLAALLASVLRPAIVGRARGRHTPDLRFAAAAGSLVVEDVGLTAVPNRAAVLARRARERVRGGASPSEETQVGSPDS
jgi:sugar/nucleoside kinase (ribokinase family)